MNTGEHFMEPFGGIGAISEEEEAVSEKAERYVSEEAQKVVDVLRHTRESCGLDEEDMTFCIELEERIASGEDDPVKIAAELENFKGALGSSEFEPLAGDPEQSRKISLYDKIPGDEIVVLNMELNPEFYEAKESNVTSLENKDGEVLSSEKLELSPEAVGRRMKLEKMGQDIAQVEELLKKSRQDLEDLLEYMGEKGIDPKVDLFMFEDQDRFNRAMSLCDEDWRPMKVFHAYLEEYLGGSLEFVQDGEIISMRNMLSDIEDAPKVVAKDIAYLSDRIKDITPLNPKEGEENVPKKKKEVK